MNDQSPSKETAPRNWKANSNIKERLNLHVKRRIQETEVVPGTYKRTERIPSTGSGRGGKKSKSKHTLPPVTTPEDEFSRDCNSNDSPPVPAKDKNNSPDLLTMALNQKKLSLLRDPEVVKFLENITEIIGR